MPAKAAAPKAAAKKPSSAQPLRHDGPAPLRLLLRPGAEAGASWAPPRILAPVTHAVGARARARSPLPRALRDEDDDDEVMRKRIT
eukprot:gene42036-8028_t